MALTLGFNNVADLLEKLKRDAALLQTDAITADRFMNFVLTGYALIDWIKNDPAVPISAKQATVVQNLYTNHTLKVCGDLANSVKHFTLTTRLPITKNTVVHSGFGVGRYGMGDFGEGEQEIVITLNDGTVLNPLDFVRAVLTVWENFFAAHGI
jgi:hypothetical protein|tara:strand:+ start:1673 stop:2134 length:462 start_codon:yes stop_codon:yes gene_type:complete